MRVCADRRFQSSIRQSGDKWYQVLLEKIGKWKVLVADWLAGFFLFLLSDSCVVVKNNDASIVVHVDK